MLERVNHYDLLKKYVSGERDFDRIVLNGVDLTGAVLRSASFNEANFNYATLTRINLSNSSLIKTYFLQANLQNANLRNTNLQKSCLTSSNLQQAFLEESNLKKADLQGANLQGAYLHKACLQGANLKDALLNEAFLESSYYDQETCFDEDFDPTQAGMILSANLTNDDRNNLNLNNHLHESKFEFLTGDAHKDNQTVKSFFQKHRSRHYLINKLSLLLEANADRSVE